MSKIKTHPNMVPSTYEEGGKAFDVMVPVAIAKGAESIAELAERLAPQIKAATDTLSALKTGADSVGAKMLALAKDALRAANGNTGVARSYVAGALAAAESTAAGRHADDDKWTLTKACPVWRVEKSNILRALAAGIDVTETHKATVIVKGREYKEGEETFPTMSSVTQRLAAIRNAAKTPAGPTVSIKFEPLSKAVADLIALAGSVDGAEAASLAEAINRLVGDAQESHRNADPVTGAKAAALRGGSR